MNGTASKNTGPYIVAGIVSIFLIVIAYMMFFLPKMNESKALVSQAATAHTNNAALTAKAEKIGAIAKNIGPLKAQVDEFNLAFPSAAQQQNMIDTINQAAASTGVTLTTLNPSAPAPKKDDTAAAPPPPVTQAKQSGTDLPGPAPAPASPATQAAAASTAQLGTVSLKIDGTGTLDAVQAFVVKLESLKRPILVHELQIDKLENGYHVMANGETFLSAPLVAPAGSK
ncbi:hypothetical protein GCM10023063_20350 [Arthrobacter methylotrophus]|uniref:Uncharacterized protein n=1 Tax=Arthrobacter methylotrophus TaxID=121291 RepID=A0ABV5UXS0_9MICC